MGPLWALAGVALTEEPHTGTGLQGTRIDLDFHGVHLQG